MTGWNIDLPGTMYLSGDSPDYEKQWMVNALAGAQHIGIDTETTGLVKWKDIPLYWSVAWDNYRATLSADTLYYFKNVFADPTKDWVLANAKYDMHILANVGIELLGRWNCIQVMHSLLYEDKPHKLKYICQQILGWTWADFQDTFGKIGKKQSAEDVIRKAESSDMQLLIEYAANDAWGTLGGFWELKKQLEASYTYSLFQNIPPYINTLWDFFTKVELPYTKVLWKMERRGILVDVPHLERSEPTAKKEIVALEKEITKLAGYNFNPRSTPQLQKYFFEQQNMSPLRMTKGGKSGVRKPSVDEKFLEYHKNDSPMAGLLTKHRELSKLHGTYIVGLRDLCDPNGRIHTSFNQDVARTGRLSSSGPNLQNIPRPENDKWNLRGAFITQPGWGMVASDYSQLEMRLLAVAAEEQDMADIFKRGWDIHCGNAALMYNMPYEDITTGKKLSKDADSMQEAELIGISEEKSPGISQRALESGSSLAAYLRLCAEYRAAAKNIGFGLNYGMGPTKLANDLGCTRKEAMDKIDTYKATYPAVTNFFKEAVEEARRYGYSFTILGRRRNLPQILSNNRADRAAGERLAVNTQIQGSAADVTKVAQLNIDALGLDNMYNCHMLLQIHDELVFECPQECVENVKLEVEEMMAHPFCKDLLVPLDAEAGSGLSWGEAK